MGQIAVKEPCTIRSFGLTKPQSRSGAEGAHRVLTPSLLLAGKGVIHLDGLGARRELEKVRRALELDDKESMRI